MAKRRFIVQVGDTYFMTQGKHLVYDPKEAKTKEQEEGIKKVAAKFQEIHDQPHTWYKAVCLTDGDFSASNSSDE